MARLVEVIGARLKTSRTGSTLDRRETVASAHLLAGDPRLHAPLWDGKLWFAGSEFAKGHAGYLEGAVVDAAGVVSRLSTKKAGLQSMSELYAICRSSDIADSQAAGFVLMRAESNGESKPWPILITRKGNRYYGFENACPHLGSRLDETPGQFLDDDGNFLTCGRHRAQFDLDTGHCFIGPCQGRRLTPVHLVLDEGDVCVSGVRLAEEDGLDLPDPDAMPEVMIQPD